MLELLQIRNFALIKSLDINFYRGCHIFTGETGAGKSIILNSIKALLGYKINTKLIHPEEDYAEVIAIFNLEDFPHVKEKISLILPKINLTLKDNQFIIKRIWGKRTMIWVNDSIITLKILKLLAPLMLDYFSPGDQFDLLELSHQRDILDRFIHDKDLLEKLCSTYKNWQIAKENLAQFQQEHLSTQEMERMRTEFKEIQQAEIQEAEDKSLADEYNQAYFSQELIETSYKAQEILSLNDLSIKNHLALIRKFLSILAEKDEENTRDIMNLLESLATDINTLSFSLDSYSSNLNVNEEKIHSLNQRMELINDIKRKYGANLEQVLTYYKKIQEKLQIYDSFEQEKNLLEQKVCETEEVYLLYAQKMRQLRKNFAKKFRKKIQEEFAQLQLKEAQFDISFSEKMPSSVGIDELSFQFSTHKSVSLKALNEQASSGEIMRIILAIKIILSQFEKIPIVIFDEIDANIGGKTANKIAQKLRFLAEKSQILCITHSPQIASSAHYHYKITKKNHDKQLEVHIESLDYQQKIEEIMRMLGGEEVSAVSRQHAEDLIQNLGYERK